MVDPFQVFNLLCPKPDWWFDFNAMMSRVILCLEVKESQSLYVHIYIFVSLFLWLISMACQPDLGYFMPRG